MTDVIEAHDLRKSFASRRGTTSRPSAASASPSRPGEIFGFLGPNGAGKTTTLRMLTTLLPIDAGTATVAGFDVAREPKRVRTRIGYVSQLGGADDLATGRENLVLQGTPLRRRDARRSPRASSELLELLDLASFADRRVKTYSGGQRRRLDVALGIVHEPEVLFLDEPTTGLDPQNRANLWDHVRAPARARHDGLPDDALPRGGRQPLRSRDDHRPRPDRRRGQPARAQARGGRRLGRAARRRRRPRASVRARCSPPRRSSARSRRGDDGQLRCYVEDGAAALPEILRLLDGAQIGAARDQPLRADARRRVPCQDRPLAARRRARDRGGGA